MRSRTVEFGAIVGTLEKEVNRAQSSWSNTHVEEMALATGVSSPRVLLLNTEVGNAAAAGASSRDG